jgi:hypothetical protein
VSGAKHLRCSSLHVAGLIQASRFAFLCSTHGSPHQQVMSLPI